MKKQILTISLALISIGIFAQKKELRNAEKALKKNDYASAMTLIKSVEGMLETMDSKYKAQFYFLKGQALAGQNKFEAAADTFNDLFAYEKQIGKQEYSNDAKPILSSIVQKVSQQGADLYNNDKNFSEAAKKFYITYKLSPKDTSFLYNAAISATLAKDYEAGLSYFMKLKEIGYTGIATEYLAVDKKTGETVNFGSKNQRDLMMKTKNYKNPSNKVSPSKQPEIVKNIGYIYVSLGKTEEAITALKEARKSNPKDVNLILNEAQLYIKLNEMKKFGELMEEAIKLDPNNPTLFFNLGVVNANEGRSKEAVEYYKKAIELKPDYADAYMNLSIAILADEQAIIDEMNKNLSNFKKYDELALKQKELYKKALPYLEKADSLSRTLETVRSLSNIYSILEMSEKSKEYTKLYKEMKN